LLNMIFICGKNSNLFLNKEKWKQSVNTSLLGSLVFFVEKKNLRNYKN